MHHPFSRPRPCVLVACVLAATCLTCGAGREGKAQQRSSRAGPPIRDEDHRSHRHVKSWLELRTQNVVMQQLDYSCGAAALATLIRYHWGDQATEMQFIRELVQMLTVEELRALIAVES